MTQELATGVNSNRVYSEETRRRIQENFPSLYDKESALFDLELSSEAINANLFSVKDEGPIIEENMKRLTSKKMMELYTPEDIVDIRKSFRTIYFKNLEIRRYNNNRCISEESEPRCTAIETLKEKYGMDKRLPQIEIGQQWDEFDEYMKREKEKNAWLLPALRQAPAFLKHQ